MEGKENQKSNILDSNQKTILQKIAKIIELEIEEESDIIKNKDVYYTRGETDIITLSLANLNLKIIPEIISQLKEIISLNISRNELIDFPELLLSLKKISILDISRNKIYRLPNWIGELPLLRELHLNNNQLYSIPSSISNCSLLRRIYLHNNQIHTLPFDLIEIKLLEEIHLDFRTTMHKKVKGILSNLEANGCKVISDYNRR
ncbi:MAG: hypothetical protein HZR80_09400 [Candidatus Heimdallarchaeota archaeon]